MSEADLCARLQSWATNEMRYQPQLSAANLKSITQGSNKEIWNFIVKHVRSIETARTVRGNLMLNKKQPQLSGVESDKRENLKQQRDKLSEEVAECLNDIEHVEKDIKRIHSEIDSTETNCQNACEATQNTARGAALLRMHSQRSSEMVTQFKEFKDKIDARSDAILKRSNNNMMAGKEADGSRQVDEACDSIGQFLNQTLQGSFAGDLASARKMNLWRQVETILSELTVPQVIASLVRNSRKSAADLNTTTQNINIKKDAEKLRFKFERPGQLTDVSSSTPLLQSVQQVLEENQLSHVNDFMMTQKALNMAKRRQLELSPMQQQFSNDLAQLFYGKPNEFQLAKQALECERDLVLARATMATFYTVKDKLQSSLQISQVAQDKIHLVYQKIHDFQKIADSKQSLIRVLSKQNLNARSRLDAQKSEIALYISQSLSTHLADTSALANQLVGGVVTEVDGLSRLSLPLLVQMNLDGISKVGLVNLSINQWNEIYNTSMHQSLRKTMDAVDFPSHKATEYILPWCKQLRDDLMENLQVVESLSNSDKQSPPDPHGISGDIEDLCNRSTEQDRMLLNRLLPVLNKRVIHVGNGIADCLKTYEALEDWWNQPAKNCVPWIKVDDSSFSEWQNAWGVVSASLVWSRTLTDASQ